MLVSEYLKKVNNPSRLKKLQESDFLEYGDTDRKKRSSMSQSEIDQIKDTMDECEDDLKGVIKGIADDYAHMLSTLEIERCVKNAMHYLVESGALG